jgi:hypothetical protein
VRRVLAHAAVAASIFVVACGSTVAEAGADPSPTQPVGNVSPKLAPVTGVGAAASSSPVDGRVAVLVQNTTTSAVRIDRVTATATRSDGGLTTGARTAKAYPQVLAPGELALAAVQFRARDVPPGSTFAVKVRSTRVSSTRVARGLAASDLVLSAPRTGRVAQTLRATLTNVSTSWTARGAEAAVMCFGEAGTPTTFADARASTRRIAPGKTARASVPLTSLCPSYLVAARPA